MKIKFSESIFDYRILRFLTGFIAFALPWVVWIWCCFHLPSSISAAYCTDARNVFVGMLFMVGALLWAYNGHAPIEACLSKVAGSAAFLVALFPTSCACLPGYNVIVHYASAALLFIILSIFCFHFFRKKVKGMGGKKRLRSGIYLTCGCVMISCIVLLLLLTILERCRVLNIGNAIFWLEVIALWAFGVSWTASGKNFRFLVDEEKELVRFFN